ncbi:hypothetical protein FRB94_002053 [Tulasnella sp. JGI-2019a]|nr:hypothetical protein FRB94_002053 [Tulasnella sp. JGI-2019a]
MVGKEFKAGGDNKHGWVRALLKKFMGSWGSGPTPDTPPPYTPGEKVINESKTLHHKTPLTSRARIMGVDEYGRVLGYISPAYKAASWFNFQPAKKALILEVPIADRNESISSGSEESSEPFRLRMLASDLNIQPVLLTDFTYIRIRRRRLQRETSTFSGYSYTSLVATTNNGSWPLATKENPVLYLRIEPTCLDPL